MELMRKVGRADGIELVATGEAVENACKIWGSKLNSLWSLFVGIPASRFFT